MLGNPSVWEVAARCHELLADADVPHAVVGGMAVCLHGYRRNTVDVDLLVRRTDALTIRKHLTAAGFTWSKAQAEFRSPSAVPVQLLMAEDRAGRDSEVRLPDPGDVRTVTKLEGLPVLTLAKLIESKLACGQANVRRTHKDFADVVELVAAHRLSKSFAARLHPSVRQVFRLLVDHARG